MDSNDSKARNDYPRWPASKGPGFCSAFLQEMAGFIPHISQLPQH